MLTALILMMAAQSPYDGPAKLVILFGGQAAAITDYPSMARCGRAKADLERQALEKAQHDMPGYKVISLSITAYCIPG